MLQFFTARFGAIFAKEAIEIARRSQYYFARVFLAGLLLLSVFLASIRIGRDVPNSSTSAAEKIKIQSMIASSVVGHFESMQFLAIYLLGPLFLCGAVAAERREGTLELLFTTQLTDREIIIGKFSSRVAVMFLLVLGGLPVLSMMMLLGGISWPQVFFVEFTALLAVILISSVSVYFTTTCASPLRALLASYAASAGILLILTPFLAPFLSATSTAAIVVGVLANTLAAGGISYPLLRGAVTKLRQAPAVGRSDDPRRVLGKRLPEEEEAATALDCEGAGTTTIAAKAALWGPLRIAVDRDDPPLRENLWVFAFLAAAFGFCFYIFVYVNPVNSGAIGVILAPVWVCILGATVLLSVTNPLFTRRPGFFDTLLNSRLEPHEILLGAVLVSWPVLLRLFVAPWLLSALWVAGNPGGLTLSALIGTLLGCLIVALGNLCSLADFRPLPRLGPTVAFPALATLAPWVLGPSLITLDAAAWWLICCGAVVATTLWTRRTTRAAAAGCHFIAVYSLLVATFVCAPVAWFKPELLRPAGGAWLSVVHLENPLFWLMRLLGWTEEEGKGNPWLPFGCLYAAALTVNLIWVWRWTNNNFDRLVGRSHWSDRGRAAMPPVVPSAAAFNAFAVSEGR